MKDFEKKMKPKSASLRDKLSAVEELARGRNAKLVAPLAKTCLTEKALTGLELAASGRGRVLETYASERERAAAALACVFLFHAMRAEPESTVAFDGTRRTPSESLSYTSGDHCCRL